MGAHAEIELKWDLAPEAHARLAACLGDLLGPAQRLDQTNRFFDTAGFALRNAGMSLRVRAEDLADGRRLLLTCKRRLAECEQAHHHEEWEEWLDPAVWPQLADGDPAVLLPLPEHVRSVVAGQRLRPLGGFTNARLEWQHGDELLCLDRTDFALRVDHELEIETPRPGETGQAWAERLRGWGIPWQKQETSKFARYMLLGGAVDIARAARQS